MRIVLDTNVILDVLLDRKPFTNDSLSAIQKAIEKGDILFFSASSVTDVYYVVRKLSQDKNYALESIKRLSNILSFAEVNEECLLAALNSKMNDYEDAVIDAVAESIKANLIITRNVDDFKNAKTAIMSPTMFLKVE